MRGNVQRSTPSLFLIVWGVLMTVVLLFAWGIELHRDEYMWTEYPSGLGDRDFYTQLSENDFYTAALKIPGQSAGHFRRAYKPVQRDDAKMQRLARDGSDRVFVYKDVRKPQSVYLKVADDHYIEFGERRFWPEYQPPKAIPVTIPP